MAELNEEIKEVSPNHKVTFVTAGSHFIDEEITRENSGHVSYKSEEDVKQKTPMPYDRELFMVKPKRGTPMFLAMKKSRFAIAKYLVKDFISRKASYISSLLKGVSSE